MDTGRPPGWNRVLSTSSNSILDIRSEKREFGIRHGHTEFRGRVGAPSPSTPGDEIRAPQGLAADPDRWPISTSRGAVAAGHVAPAAFTRKTLRCCWEARARFGPGGAHSRDVSRRRDQRNRTPGGAACGGLRRNSRRRRDPGRGPGVARQAVGIRGRGAPRDKRGVTGKRFKHVVNIGIGGSDLGRSCVCEALRHEWSGEHHAAFRIERGPDPARGSDAHPGSAPKRWLMSARKTFTTAGDAGERGCRQRLDRGAAGGGLARPGTSPRLGPPTPPHGRVRSRGRPPLSRCGIGWADAIRSGRRSA